MSEQKKKTYYDLLGLSFYASPEDIRRNAENALGRLDAAGTELDDATKAQLAAQRRVIVQAYATLKDPVKRQAYNAAIATNISSAARAASEANAARAANATGATNESVETTNSAAHASASAATPAKYAAVDLRSSMQGHQTNEDPQVVIQYGDAPMDEPAGVIVRFVALLIDTTLLSFGIVILAVTALVLTRFMPEGIALLIGRLLGFMMLLAPIAYYAVGECSKYRATPGKWLMGLAVYRSDGETPLSWLRAAARVPLRVLSSVFFYAGYWIAFFTENKQTLHDLISDTVVYRREEASALQWLYAIICILVLTMLYFGMKKLGVDQD